jgi:hypothetical protein
VNTNTAYWQFCKNFSLEKNSQFVVLHLKTGQGIEWQFTQAVSSTPTFTTESQCNAGARSNIMTAKWRQFAKLHKIVARRGRGGTTIQQMTQIVLKLHTDNYTYECLRMILVWFSLHIRFLTRITHINKIHKYEHIFGIKWIHITSVINVMYFWSP